MTGALASLLARTRQVRFSSPPVLGGVDAFRGRGGAVFEYGISKEPTYPLFYYNMACGYGELGDEDNATKWLRRAVKKKASTLPSTRLPNPETDSSFEKFRDSEKFQKKAIAEMKRNQD